MTFSTTFTLVDNFYILQVDPLLSDKAQQYLESTKSRFELSEPGVFHVYSMPSKVMEHHKKYSSLIKLEDSVTVYDNEIQLCVHKRDLPRSKSCGLKVASISKTDDDCYWVNFKVNEFDFSIARQTFNLTKSSLLDWRSRLDFQSDFTDISHWYGIFKDLGLHQKDYGVVDDCPDAQIQHEYYSDICFNVNVTSSDVFHKDSNIWKRN